MSTVMLSGHPQPMETPCGSGAGMGGTFLYSKGQTRAKPLTCFASPDLTGPVKYRAETSPRAQAFVFRACSLLGKSLRKTAALPAYKKPFPCDLPSRHFGTLGRNKRNPP
jgi:hypothetical protein